ncbi:MAG: hypothetical protein IKE05_04620 [Clostridia bacterium]|nr:hypothetical protein [Clostridia bacterium]
MGDIKIKKLQNQEIESIVGGAITVKEFGKGVFIGCGVIAAASLISSFACQIASVTYGSQADRAEKSGNLEAASKLRKSSKNTGIAAASLAGAAFVSTGVGVAVGLPTGGANDALFGGSIFLTRRGL